MMNPIFQSAVNNLQRRIAMPVPGAAQPAPAAVAQPMPVNNAFAARAGIPARGTIMPARPPMAAMPVMARPVMPAPGAAPVGTMPPVQNALAQRFASAY